MYLDAVVGQLEEIRGTIRTHGTEGDVVEAKVLSAGQHIGVGIDASDQLAHNDT